MKKCSLLFSLVFIACLSVFSLKQQEAQFPEGLIASAKEFVSLLVKEDYTTAVKSFDETMSKVMPPEKLKEAWESLISRAGAFKKQTGFWTQQLPKYDIVYVTCTFQLASVDMKVVFDKQKQITGFFFVPAQTKAEYKPPAYVKVDSFKEGEVVVGTGEWSLPGTLTLPDGDGPFPALVLVHGSGPNDRDETIGPNKPFRDLAWGLASRGIAVVRYDKRTKVHGAKISSQKVRLTVKEETIDDAVLAADLLKNTARIDPKKIFVLGHSLGGLVIPRIGMLAPDIRGLIIMAGPTRPLEDLLLEQTTYILSIDGKLSEDEKKRINEVENLMAKIKALSHESISPEAEEILNAPPEYWLDLREYNPLEASQKVKQPMLILQGERDYQVTTVDFEGWKKALSSRKNVSFKLYPGLNHLFIEGKGKSTPNEYQKAGHVAEYVIEDIASWIEKSVSHSQNHYPAS